MNIFALSPSLCPKESARFHCDQHLHKMILESAQMLSTAYSRFRISSEFLYKPAYHKHPCTIWAGDSLANALWLCELAMELETIRQELNHPFHSSSDVIKFCYDTLYDIYPEVDSRYHTPFVFAGPTYLSLNPSLSIPQKYQLYYQKKAKDWLDKGRRMSYKDRPIPDFMASVLSQSP